MAETPLVSVVVPTYNRSDLIIEAVRAVKAQSYPRWELVVVDDGSDDDTRERLSGFLGPCVRYVWQPNAGQGAARNRGVAEGRGELVAFLDSDDLWLPDKLDRQIGLLRRNPRAGVVFGEATRLVNGSEAGRFFAAAQPSRGFVLRPLLLRNFIVASTVLVRRELLERSGGFDPNPDLRNVEDYDLWLRLAAECEFDFVPEPVALYRVHDGNASRNSRQTLRAHLIIYGKVIRDRRVPASLRGLAAARFLQDAARLLKATAVG